MKIVRIIIGLTVVLILLAGDLMGNPERFIVTRLNRFESREAVSRFASEVSFAYLSLSKDYVAEGKSSCQVKFFSDQKKISPSVTARYIAGAYPYRNWSVYEGFYVDIFNPQNYTVKLHLVLRDGIREKEVIFNLPAERWWKAEVKLSDLVSAGLNVENIVELAFLQKPDEMKDMVNTLYFDNLRLVGREAEKIGRAKRAEELEMEEARRREIKRERIEPPVPRFSQLGKITKIGRVPIVAKADVVVVGGGLAGVAAAVSAAREGVKVILIERAGALGGMSTSGFVPMAMRLELNRGILLELVRRLQELGGEEEWRNPEMIKYALLQMVKEAKVKLLLYTWAVDAVVRDGVIKGVIVESKSGRQAILGRVIVDATGDGDVSAFSGVPFEIGRGRDTKTQKVTLVYLLGNVDTSKVPLINRIFSGKYQEALARGEIDAPAGTAVNCEVCVAGEHGVVCINSINVPGGTGLDVTDLTWAHLECQRQIMEQVKFFRKYMPGCENCYLLGTAPYIGVRESRRIIGEYVLTGEDVVQGRYFRDGIARGFYPIDVHDVSGGDIPWLPLKTPYEIPYRCLVPKKIENLLVAGRCVSADHVAHGSLRVQGTTIALGQAAGVAAALSVKIGVHPRKLNPVLLRKALRRQGVNLGEDTDPGNISLRQYGTKVEADSTYEKGFYPPEAAIDGIISGESAKIYDFDRLQKTSFFSDMRSRWLSAETAEPHWLVVDLGKEKKFDKIKLHFWTESYVVKDYKLQYEKEGRWVDIISVVDNKDLHPVYLFEPIMAQRVRFFVTKASPVDSIVRLCEIEICQERK